MRKVFSSLGVLGCIVLAACTTTGEQTTFRPIGAEEARIVLRDPAFPEASQRHAVREDRRSGNRYEALAAGTGDYWLESTLVSSGPSYVWKTVKTHPREFLPEWPIFKDTDFIVGKKSKIKTTFGFVDVWRISSRGYQCVAWNHYLDRRHGVDFYGGRFDGYFCGLTLRKLSDERAKRVMEGFGLRGYGLPLPAPAPPGTPA